ncbi:Lrp-AsnC family transcriptional regulator [Candidatus Mancarchaeum acidiphilum]|uniref:Lrp-AsnC family transcriptional regulator n=1 Tax=Candidatus Mancarchaeum acidiphilum TaxID=1920749 RepID=A0A218NMQ6_9ARCH|nr:Lrp/AsnC family transcriptional regulator [Candidatus Mancarchaeum acidiphilum]ASI13736.1 Lrp-AsnC family transcriptional regulator [Candidatus Mancarchaeum acidiphilum]
MVDVPEKVQEAFDELKNIYGNDLEIKSVNDKFCVFRINVNDASEQADCYMGYITANGIVILEDSKQASASSEGTNIKERRSKAKNAVVWNSIGEDDINLLKALSMNSRLSFKRLSEITGISIHALEYRIERLERLLGIKYTLELNMNNLGFSEYMILAKFTGNKLNLKDIKGVLKKNLRVQLALATNGIYDLVIFCVAENNNIIADVLDDVRNSEYLKYLEAEWYITPISSDYGFIPLRQEFFDALKEKIWQRKKKDEHPNSSSLMYREYVLLRELTEDSRNSFSFIDKKYNLPAGSAKKAYKDLTNEEGKNVIVRSTLTISIPEKKYDGIIIANLTNKGKLAETKNKHRNYIIGEPNKIVNKFSYICDMETPDGIFYLFPVLEDGNREKIESELSQTIGGVKFNSLMVEKIISGSIDYRKFDNLYSRQYINLVKDKSIKVRERIIYN